MNEHDHTDKDEPATKPAHDEVAKKAYAIYLKEGRPQGHAEQNWLESEAQLQPVGSDHPAQQPEGNAWHSRSAEDVLGQVGSKAAGLSAAEAARRLAADGPNELKEGAPISLLHLFLAQFKSLIIWILITHQDPGFIDHGVNKRAEVVRVYLPPDANCLLSVMNHCLRSRHYVNVVIAGKHPAPQWLSIDAALKHCTEGIGIWQWASNDHAVAPDVVMAYCGDVPRLETLAAVSTMREHLPGLKIRVVNVVDLMKLEPPTEHPHWLSDMDFDGLFTKDKPVIFA